jgi:hypothetical protein
MQLDFLAPPKPQRELWLGAMAEPETVQQLSVRVRINYIIATFSLSLLCDTTDPMFDTDREHALAFDTSRPPS